MTRPRCGAGRGWLERVGGQLRGQPTAAAGCRWLSVTETRGLGRGRIDHCGLLLAQQRPPSGLESI